MIHRLTYKAKNYFAQSDGLGFLQIYNLLKTLVLVIISIVMAKFIKDVNTINSWETILLLSTITTFFYVSGLGYTLVGFVKRYPLTEQQSIFNSTFVLLLVCSLASSLLIVLLVSSVSILSLSYNSLLMLCIYTIGQSCSTLIEYVYFINKQFKKLIIWGIVNFISFFLIATVPFLLGNDIDFTLQIMAIYGAVKLIISLRFTSFPSKEGSVNYINKLVKFNWPIVVSLIFGTGYVYLATFMIKLQVSDIDFNIFRYGSRDFPLFIVLANSFSIVLGGLSSEKILSNEFWSSTRKSHLRLMHQIFPLACVLMIGSEFIFKTVFSEDFGRSYLIFNLLLLTVCFRTLFPQSLLLGKGKTNYSFFAALIEFGVAIVLVLFLTPTYGVTGATVALVLAYLVEKLVLIGFCYYQKIEFHKGVNWTWYIFYTLLLLACFAYSLQFGT